jgi:hypothetical protein
VGPRSGLDAVERRVPCPCEESYRKLDSSAFQPVALSLYRLSYHESTRMGNMQICAFTFRLYKSLSRERVTCRLASIHLFTEFFWRKCITIALVLSRVCFTIHGLWIGDSIY